MRLDGTAAPMASWIMPALPQWVAGAAIALLALGLPAGALGAQCADGSPPPCGSAPPSLPVDPRAIAILPFRVLGPPETQYLGEGMVDLFQIALDGVGGHRVLYPRATLRRLRQLADPSDALLAAPAARGLGAGLVLGGSIVVAGAELRVRAELFDAVRVRRLAVANARGDLSRPAPLVDSLAVAILRGRLVAGSDAPHRPLDQYSTTSPLALQAFLVAEQLERQGEYRAAAESLGVAIERDSSFGLAHFVLLRIVSNAPGLVPSFNTFAVLREGLRHADRLPQRLRDYFLFADSAVQGRRLTALRLARQRAQRYPRDAEIAHEVAEIYFRFGLSVGEPWERVLAAQREAFALDDTFLEAYPRYLMLLAGAGDTATAWEVMRRFRQLAPDSPFAENIERGMRALLRHEDPWRLATGASPVATAFVISAARPDDLAWGVTVADSFAALGATPDQSRNARAAALSARVAHALSRGQYSAAWNLLAELATLSPPDDPLVAARRVAHTVITGDHLSEAAGAAQRLLADTALALQPAAALGWYAALFALPQDVERALRPLQGRPWPETLIGEDLAEGLRGLLALRLGDTAQARDLLLRAYATRSPVFGPSWILLPNVTFSLTLARLELAAGDPASALRRTADLDPRVNALPFLTEGEELRARIFEQLGDTAAARSAWRNVIGLWDRSDAALQPRVAAARAALARLERN